MTATRGARLCRPEDAPTEPDRPARRAARLRGRGGRTLRKPRTMSAAVPSQKAAAPPAVSPRSVAPRRAPSSGRSFAPASSSRKRRTGLRAVRSEARLCGAAPLGIGFCSRAEAGARRAGAVAAVADPPWRRRGASRRLRPAFGAPRPQDRAGCGAVARGGHQGEDFPGWAVAASRGRALGWLAAVRGPVQDRKQSRAPALASPPGPARRALPAPPVPAPAHTRAHLRPGRVPAVSPAPRARGLERLVSRRLTHSTALQWPTDCLPRRPERACPAPCDPAGSWRGG